VTFLFLHGLNSISGIKPTYLKDHGHMVLNPESPMTGVDDGNPIHPL
jgi:hypothetical protein